MSITITINPLKWMCNGMIVPPFSDLMDSYPEYTFTIFRDTNSIKLYITSLPLVYGGPKSDKGLYYYSSGSEVIVYIKSVDEWTYSETFTVNNPSTLIFEAISYRTAPNFWCNSAIIDAYDGGTKFSAFRYTNLNNKILIEWDGDTSGLVASTDGKYKVADITPAKELSYNSQLSWVIINGLGISGAMTESYAVENYYTYPRTDPLTPAGYGYEFSSVAVIYDDNVSVDASTTYPQKGLYFADYVRAMAFNNSDIDAITSVKVYPSTVTMKPGTDRIFEAVVNGTGTFDSSVDWTVHYGSEYGTPTITQDGQLTIPADMRPCTVIVLARSVEDPTKGGIAEVNVVRDTVYDDVSGPAGGNGSYGAGERTGYTASGVPLGSNTFDHANTTMATLYALTGPKLNEFGNWLWSTDFDDAITKAQVEFLYGKVSDGVISLVSYPFGITTESTGECLIADEANFARVGNITFYKLESEFSANILQSSDAQIDWGTLNIDEYWGSFLDYSPYTTIELYLPWSTGFVPLNVNEVMGKPLSVKTNIELSTGSCVHNIISGEECIASYSGQVGVPIPLTSSDLANKLMKIGASAAIMAVGGAIAGAAVATGVSAAYSHGASYQQRSLAGKTPFIPGKANRIINQDIRQANAYGEAIINEAADITIPIASAAARQATNVTRNGAFSADTASMTIQYPYLVISRPDISVPENYANFYGYPSNITSMLKDLTGYTEVANIHLENVNATADELVLLEKTLKGGVIL